MKKKRNKIHLRRGQWTFGSNVPKQFDNHIIRSIPGYLEGHELIKKISEFFLTEKSVCYDVGSSTGTLLKKLSDYNRKNIKLIGIEIEKKMISQAKKNLKSYKNIHFLNKNITKCKLLKNNLVIFYYTLAFITPHERQTVVNKVFKSLSWGGAMIVFDKVRSPDARFQDITNQIYRDWKIEQKFSIKEIAQKELSLRGVMEPFSSKANLEIFKRAGFKDVTTIYKNICFEGFLCIK